jgi:pyruvate/2-oxoglutarate dehydrogenase complex dihydrolipoamide dehydrogenase (E3) component
MERYVVSSFFIGNSSLFILNLIGRVGEARYIWRVTLSEQFDVVVIGGGTAGLVTASGCARLGRRVALIEKEALGGDCLWTGCVPTKALVATARLLHQLRHADAYGLEPVEIAVDPKRIMESMRTAQSITAKHDDPEKFRKLGIDVIEGQARFVSPREVEVAGRRLYGTDIVIAAGSRTAVPPIPGLTETGFLDHVSFLQRDSFPRSVVILGGGPIGVEFAQMLRRFGADVVVVELAADICSREDGDAISAIRDLLHQEGIQIRTGWKGTRAERTGGQKALHIESNDGRNDVINADEIFVASGRRGNIEDLGLESAGVRVERSYVVVDDHLETTTPHIWACGDIHGHLQFTHVAAYEAVKLVRNMLFPGKSTVDYDNIPWATYTDPELAHLGDTESEARRKHGDGVRIFKVAMEDVDRAVVDRVPRGFIKFITDKKGRILGAHALCANASTVIEEIVLARKQGVKLGGLAQLVSPYPSLADAVQKAAALYYQDIGTSWLGSVARRVAAWTQ